MDNLTTAMVVRLSVSQELRLHSVEHVYKRAQCDILNQSYRLNTALFKNIT